MTRRTDRVVVTGLGATTPLGGDVASTWSAMLAGKSGVRRLSEDWAEDIPASVVAPVAVEPESVIRRVQLRQMDRCEQFALIAARQAWQDAGQPQVAPERLGVSMSTATGGVLSVLDAYETLRVKGWQRVPPFTLPMMMPNGAGAWISIELGARAVVQTSVSACASGAEAIGHGIEMIRSGQADVVVAGGTEAAIYPLSFAAFGVVRAISFRDDEPERVSRPFDKARDGFVMGEGAGALVLESAEHAERRGAVVHAVAAGVGYSGDAYHLALANPDGAAAALAIGRALADAQASPDQVVHINAHATSTPAGDAAEAAAIGRAMRGAARNVVVSATKSMTGHLIGGAGAVESIAAICALRDGVAPPTINLEDPDDEVVRAGFGIAAQPLELRRTPGAVALKNSFGFGGHNVALAFTAA
jgi:3-oxoacyl-[acyl-carrier-protein] synthase II